MKRIQEEEKEGRDGGEVTFTRGDPQGERRRKDGPMNRKGHKKRKTNGDTVKHKWRKEKAEKDKRGKKKDKFRRKNHIVGEKEKNRRGEKKARKQH